MEPAADGPPVGPHGDHATCTFRPKYFSSKTRCPDNDGVLYQPAAFSLPRGLGQQFTRFLNDLFIGQEENVVGPPLGIQ
jgi:hypothetical protein